MSYHHCAFEQALNPGLLQGHAVKRVCYITTDLERLPARMFPAPLKTRLFYPDVLQRYSHARLCISIYLHVARAQLTE